MGVKVRLAVVSTAGARGKLGSVKVVFTRVGLTLILLVIFLWWREFGFEKAPSRSWFEKNSIGGMKGWIWGEVSSFLYPHLWLEVAPLNKGEL
jgi:hypothetical protein